MPLQRLSTEAGARKLMQRLVDAGRCTIEQLDQAPPGHIKPESYRNLLRDPSPEPEVQRSEPRDFTPTAGTTNPAPVDLPISLEEPDW